VELYRAIIHESRRIQNRGKQGEQPLEVAHPDSRIAGTLRVAFQGARGHSAKQPRSNFVGDDITLVPGKTRNLLFTLLTTGGGLYSRAIENSLQVSSMRLRLAPGEQTVHFREVIIPINHYLMLVRVRYSKESPQSSRIRWRSTSRRFLAANPRIHRMRRAEDTAGVWREWSRG